MRSLPIALAIVTALVSACSRASEEQKFTIDEKKIEQVPVNAPQTKATKTDLQVAEAEYFRLLDDIYKNPKSPKLDDRTQKASNAIGRIRAEYQYKVAHDPDMAAKWFRERVEGKTVEDFAPPAKPKP